MEPDAHHSIADDTVDRALLEAVSEGDALDFALAWTAGKYGTMQDVLGDSIEAPDWTW